MRANMPAKATSYNKILSFIFLTLTCPVGCGHLSSVKYKTLYITAISTYIFNYNSDYIGHKKHWPQEKMSFEHKEVLKDAEKEPYPWEINRVYQLLSKIRNEVTKNYSASPNFGACQDKWVVIEDGAKIGAYKKSLLLFELKYYDSFANVLNSHKGIDSSKIFVYQIGTDYIGPLDYVTKKVLAEQHIPTVGLAEEDAETEVIAPDVLETIAEAERYAGKLLEEKVKQPSATN
jgi:hypothetical protein